jgi:hypothetical protein
LKSRDELVAMQEAGGTSSGSIVTSARMVKTKERTSPLHHHQASFTVSCALATALTRIVGLVGFRQFLLRGVKKVRAEWAMICTTHNLLKLSPSQRPPEAATVQQMPGRDAYLDGLLGVLLR